MELSCTYETSFYFPQSIGCTWRINIWSVALLTIVLPVRLTYFSCLLGVAAEDILWTVDQEREWKRIAVSSAILISGVVWLWFNIIIGLISLVICHIAYVKRDLDFKEKGETENWDKKWKKFQYIRSVLLYTAGILPILPRGRLPFYLCGIVALLIIALRVNRVGFRNGGLHPMFVKQFFKLEELHNRNYIANFRQDWFSESVHLLWSVVGFCLMFYKKINRSDQKEGNFGKLKPHSTSAPDVSTSSSTLETISNVVPVLISPRGLFEAIIGRNLNLGSGTQSVGDIFIAVPH